MMNVCKKLLGCFACISSIAVACAVGLAGTRAAAEESQLSQKPIPLQTEGRSLFSVEDITDYEAFVAVLMAEEENPDSPAGRVWALLPPALKAELAAVPEGELIDEKIRYRFIDGMNGVIRRGDLYQAEAFESAQLTPELTSVFAGGIETLGPVERAGANRELLQVSFPEYIQPSKVRPFRKRPETLIIFGDDFLNNGNLSKGFELPTGAVWQPSLLVFGTHRSAWQYMETGNRLPAPQLPPLSPGVPATPPLRGNQNIIEEWVNRLDLFFNLYLTPTERVVLQLRPIDEDRVFSGYVWQPDRGTEVEEWEGGLDADIEQLFFEGDLGELFPNLDLFDKHGLDVGMAVGRQPMFFQEGILINDNVDGIGFTRNNVHFPGIPKMRLTLFWGWQHVNRATGANNTRFDDSDIFGLFTQTDTENSTIDFDIVYLNGERRRELVERPGDSPVARFRGGDQLNVGLSWVKRIGHINTAFRVNQSWGMGTDDNIDAGDGTLLFTEASWTPTGTHDLVYANLFWANDEFRSIARDPSVGGPLGRAGILFESPGIGTFPSLIDNTTNEVVGGALGYQKFFDETRKQILVEVGGRGDTDGRDVEEYGIAARYQQAFKNRFLWRFDAFYVERTASNAEDRKGVRAEFVIQF